MIYLSIAGRNIDARAYFLSGYEFASFIKDGSLLTTVVVKPARSCLNLLFYAAPPTLPQTSPIFAAFLKA